MHNILCLDVLFLLLFYSHPTVSSEYYPENSVACLNQPTDKDVVACRKAMAGNLNCFQKEYCVLNGKGSLNQARVIVPFTSNTMMINQCSDQDAAKRIGMTCDTFPGYMGGYPLFSPLKWDDEWEQYTCIQNSSNTYCDKWESYESSEDEYELGVYTCQSTAVSTNGVTYCESFTSVQEERTKCDRYTDSCSPNCDRPTYCGKTCYNDGAPYDCGYYTAGESEYSVATVLTVNDDGAWLTWHQEEYDLGNMYFREYEDYTCQEVSVSGKYCHRWIGNIDSEEEFEYSTCECQDDNVAGNNFCSEWACYEAGLSYFYPCLLWCILPSLLTLICLYCYYEFNDPNYDLNYNPNDDFMSYFTYSYHWVNNFAPLCLSIAVLFLGGVPAWLIYFGISFVMQLFFRWYYWPAPSDTRHRHDPIRFESLGVNFELPTATATAYSEPSAPPIMKVDDSTHTVSMTQSEKAAFQLFKRLQARDPTDGRVV